MNALRWCVHCDVDPARRSDGICDACNTYRHKYGHLPTHDVLVKRVRRRDENRHIEAVQRRFGELVLRQPGDACWIWLGSKSSFGHGQFSARGKTYWAHRLAWEWANGAIPDGHDIDHLCDNPPCVRPDHLEPVTRSEHMRRSHQRRRMTELARDGRVTSALLEFVSVGHPS